MLLVGLLLVPSTTDALPRNPIEPIGVRVGFDGRYKVGVWTPVEVLFSGRQPPGAGKVTITVPDGDGVPSRVSAPLRGEPVLLYVRFGRIISDLTVEYHKTGYPVVRKVFRASPDDADFPPAVAADGKLIVVVGADLLGVDRAVGALHRPADEQTVVTRLSDCRTLPEKWYGYEGVDAVVISTGQVDAAEADFMPSEQQADALERWIALGGRLVLCVGSRAETVFSEGSTLARFSPGRFDRTVSLRQTGALETFAGSSVPVPCPAGQARLTMDVPRFAEVSGVVEAGEADLPLVIRTAYRFGQIIFLAAELDHGPLAEWRDRPKLIARLLDLDTDVVEEADEGTAVMHYGFCDMAGQLRSALDRFDGVRLAPFWLVAVLIVSYLLAIGPVDYFFLRKCVGRMQWTWATFPAVMLAFCALAYLLAYRLKGDEVRVHQAELIDVDVSSGLVRGASWAGVFSPRMEEFNLSLRPNSLDCRDHRSRLCDAGVTVSWLGLPGSALGGMNSKTSTPVLLAEPYDFSPGLDAMQGVPIQTWSTKSLTGRWHWQTNVDLDAKLVEQSLSPVGTITNTLGFPLADCVLAYRRWAYDLGTIEPGQSVSLGPMVKRSELKTLLTGRKIVFEEDKDKYHQQSTPYDRSSVDVAYILRAMMFFEAAGSRRYTGLSGGYQNFVDLSELLKADRAILIGRAPAGNHAAEWLRDGVPMTQKNDEHVTMYRFVLPVSPQPLAPSP